MAAMTLTIVDASPLAAQPSGPATTGRGTTGERPNTQPHAVFVPGRGTVYVVREQAKDIRTLRQRCMDEEVAREAGAPSRLAMGAIDLKCSQR